MVTKSASTPIAVKSPTPKLPAKRRAPASKASAGPAAKTTAKAKETASRSAPKKAAKPQPVPAKGNKAKTKGAERSPEKSQAKPRAKLIRDSFTMPQSDFALIDVLKQRALEFKRVTKKSELLRAGLQALADLPADALQARLNGLAELKTGRPRKAG